MNLIGESFDEFVNDQIKKRQKKLGLAGRDNENLVWQNAKTGFIKMTSMVNVIDTETANLKRYEWLQDANLKGSDLAKAFVLDTGLTDTRNNPNRIFQGVTNNTSLINNFAYGLGGTEFGINPIPGVTSLIVKHKNDGSLREAQIQLKAYNKVQFEILDLLYLRLGYSVVVEWGNTLFWENSDNEEESLSQISKTLQNFIFREGKNHFDIHNYILALRKVNSANYDAMIGRVRNYSWTINKDGHYDITLDLISYGDLIESLKVNNINKTSTNTGTDSTQPVDIFQKYKDKHAIGKHFYLIKQNNFEVISNKAQNQWRIELQNPNLNLPFTATPNVAHCYVVKFGGDKDNFQFYYRLGSFLKFLQFNSQIFNSNQGTFKNTSGTTYPPYIDFDYETDNNFLYLDKLQFAADPRICIMKKIDKNFNPNIEIQLYPSAEAGYNGDVVSYPIGRLMNVYMNFEFILNKLDELIDNNGKVNYFDLLKAICDGINESFGYINKLEPYIDADTNTIRIIERRTFPEQDKLLEKSTEKKVENTPLRLLGVKSGFGLEEGSFVRDFSFKTQMDNDIQTTIAVGAQANGASISEDATAFSKLNEGLIDRVFPEKITLSTNTQKSGPVTEPAPIVGITSAQALSEYEKTKNNALNSPEANKLLENFEESALAYDKNLEETYVTYKWNPDVYDTQKNLIKNLVQYNNALDALISNTISPTLPAIPVNLNVTLDGISGMKILQQFEVQSDFLPAGYAENLSYILKNITHKVTNNVWTTELETLFVPKAPTLPKVPEYTTLSNLENELPQVQSAAFEYQEVNNNEQNVQDIFFSNNAINLIKQFEGFRSKAYKDAVGIWTIGYGSIRRAGRAVVSTDVITESQAIELLRVDLQIFQNTVRNNFLPRNTGGKQIKFTQNEWDALLSFTYNLGAGWSKNSGLKNLIVAGDKTGAANKLLEYSKAGGRVLPGLLRRRKTERDLFIRK
jgi:lysozyme